MSITLMSNWASDDRYWRADEDRELARDRSSAILARMYGDCPACGEECEAEDVSVHGSTVECGHCGHVVERDA